MSRKPARAKRRRTESLRMAQGEAQGGSGGVGGCGGNLGRSFIEEAGRGGWVILGTQLGCALLGSVLLGKLFTPPSKVRREEKRRERE